MIALENLLIERRGFTLGPVDLEIGDGEYFVLLGPSGSGKTTLLEWVAGFVRSSAGTLRLGERDATGLPPQERALGVVYQDSALFPNMNVRENLGFSCRMRGMSAEEAARKIGVAAERLRLAHVLDSPVHQISGGEKRRVALGRALVAERKVLLLDEPLTGLDPALRREMRLELRALQRELGLTVLHITHLLGEARMLADRLGVILGGRILQRGTYDRLTRRPENHHVAAALAVENFLSGKIAGSSLICDSSGARLPAPQGASGNARARVSGLALRESGAQSAAGIFQGIEPAADGSPAAVVRVGQGQGSAGILLHATLDDPSIANRLEYGQSVHVDFSNASWDLY